MWTGQVHATTQTRGTTKPYENTFASWASSFFPLSMEKAWYIWHVYSRITLLGVLSDVSATRIQNIPCQPPVVGWRGGVREGPGLWAGDLRLQHGSASNTGMTLDKWMDLSFLIISQYMREQNETMACQVLSCDLGHTTACNDGHYQRWQTCYIGSSWEGNSLASNPWPNCKCSEIFLLPGIAWSYSNHAFKSRKTWFIRNSKLIQVSADFSKWFLT